MNNLKKRNAFSKKRIILIISFCLIMIMTLGYAYLESKLDLNGDITISNGMWGVHFANITIDSGSVTATSKPKVSKDGKSISFGIQLNSETDYYQFEVDVINSGQLDAMVSNAKLSGIPDSLQPYIDYSLTFADDKPITNNEALLVDWTDRIKVRVEFNKEASFEDFSNEKLDLTFKIPYVKVSGTVTNRNASIAEKLGLTNGAIMDTNVSYSQTATSATLNQKGVYIYDGTEMDPHPIYYFRGAVTNNNIIFANFCWKMVRTTETGGTKLIYNGIVGTGNTCNNTGTASQLESKSTFNPESNSIYVGYMYTKTTTDDTDSVIKKAIDKWYEDNIENSSKNLHYEAYLEDTIWCNDRTISSKSGNDSYFASWYRLSRGDKPDLNCPKNDSFTLKSGQYPNGNSLLKYPIALITLDEARLAGFSNSKASYNKTTYLYTGQDYWLLSPGYLSGYRTNGIHVYSSGYLSAYSTSTSYGVRPSISLKYDITIKEGGDGTVTNPYIVE